MLFDGLQQLLTVGEDGQLGAVRLQLLKLAACRRLALLPLTVLRLLLVQVLPPQACNMESVGAQPLYESSFTSAQVVVASEWLFVHGTDSRGFVAGLATHMQTANQAML